MTTSFPETKTGLRLGFAAAVALALFAGSPARADDKVLAKVNGVEIRESDVALAEEELAPSLQQMDPATRKDNVLGFLIDLQIVAKAAEDKKMENSDDFKKRLSFARRRLMMDSLLAAEGKAGTTEEAMKKVYEEAAKQITSEVEVRARHILVETEDEAKAVVEELKKGADFAELAKKKLRSLRELFNDFDTANLMRKLGQDGCLIPEASADFENPLVPPRSKKIGHERTHERLGDRLFEPDWQGHVLIRVQNKLFWHK